MRMTLDLLHEFANRKVFCLFHNCMWQSGYSEVNVSCQIGGVLIGLWQKRDGILSLKKTELLVLEKILQIAVHEVFSRPIRGLANFADSCKILGIQATIFRPSLIATVLVKFLP